MTFPRRHIRADTSAHDTFAHHISARDSWARPHPHLNTLRASVARGNVVRESVVRGSVGANMSARKCHARKCRVTADPRVPVPAAIVTLFRLLLSDFLTI
jgi:hypothetical protein